MLAIIMSMEDDRDREFVEDIYIRYSKSMFSIAFGIVNDEHDAEDCVQNTILKIMNHVERFRQAEQEKYLKRLITMVCRNIAINQYNQNKERRKMEFSTTLYNEDDEAEIMDIPDMEANVARLVVSEENCNYIKQLINQLDLKYRDVLILKSMGCDNKEIAELLGISETLVRKRYSRARAKILEIGGDELYEYRNS